VIVAVPGVAPGVTTPEEAPTVATDVLLLVHVPPAVPVGLVRVIVEPDTHIGVFPAMLPPVGGVQGKVVY